MIFRVYDSQNANNNNIDGWAKMPRKLNKQQVQTIQDPSGNLPNREITSIPSPWGRLDLVRTAFYSINEKHQVEGNSLDHKIVSDTLDIAQICFHLERFRRQDLIQCIRWDRNAELATLTQSTHSGHQALGRAWNKYLDQDKTAFNFAKIRELTLFCFVDPNTKERTIIGSNSPISLFMPAPGNLSHIAQHISFGQDKPFDGQYTPLTQRDEAFVRWLYAIRAAHPQFSLYFKEVSDYMDICKPLLKTSLQTDINQLTTQSYTNDYKRMEFTPGQPMHILDDLPIFVHDGNNTKQIAQNSDFVIRTSGQASQGSALPLVLPTTKLTASLHYVTSQWDSATIVPEQVSTPLEQRILPGDGSTYPYLTIGDFLEEKLIQLTNNLNHNAFYAGEWGDNSVAQARYLLPLKPLFFEYFTVDDLINNRMLSFKSYGNTIAVELNIPIRKGCITYIREYNPAFSTASTAIKNPIVELNFELGLIQTQTYSPLCYILPKYNNGVKLEIFEPTRGWEIVSKFKCQNTDSYSIYTAGIENNFDILRLTADELQAIIIPRPLTKSRETAEAIEYAIDLGTTNTCIAYRLRKSNQANSDIRLLSWAEDEMTVTLTQFDEDTTLKSTIVSCLSLLKLGNDKLYEFPLRTALRIDRERPNFLSAMIGMSPNLGYQHEDTPPAGSDASITNIKWDKDPNDNNLKAYISGLCVYLRKHAESYDVKNNIKLTWLYPSSMSESRQDAIRKTWEQETRGIIGDIELRAPVNEATAPYLHWHKEGGIIGRTVAMDIGGGTTDFLITGNNPKETMYLTSAHFGAYTLYEAPTHRQGAGSGFARMLSEYLSEHKDRHDSIAQTVNKMRSFISSNQSEEAVDCFFALSKRLDATGERILNMDLSDILRDDKKGRNRLKSIVLLYFCLQTYHLASLMQELNIERPLNLIFSGNGSRLLNTLGSKEFISKLVNEIFQYISEQEQTAEQNRATKAQFNPAPKESTSCGAIQATDYPELKPTRCLLFVRGKMSYNDGALTYEERDKIQLYEDLRQFTDLFHTLCNSSSLNLVQTWEYEQSSLDYIHTRLEDEIKSQDIFKTDILDELTSKTQVYVQSPLFSLMRHLIKDIAYELYPN